jgi:hypothetical protein
VSKRGKLRLCLIHDFSDFMGPRVVSHNTLEPFQLLFHQLVACIRNMVKQKISAHSLQPARFRRRRSKVNELRQAMHGADQFQILGGIDDGLSIGNLPYANRMS